MPVVLDKMIHDLDILLFLVNSDIDSIHANGISILTDSIDIANSRIRFTNGSVANVTSSRVSQNDVRKIKIFQQDLYITIDLLIGLTEVYRIVDEVEDPAMELTVEQAADIGHEVKSGDYIITGSLEHVPGRIAAQTAKQVVLQKLREAERDIVFDEFSDKEGEILTATVQRIESQRIVVDLGKSEASMPIQEQSQYERYRPGQQLKFYLLQVGRSIRGPEIVVSRTHPDLLRRLFEIEVPEIFNGVVEIKAIVRDPGSRSKVAVISTQEGVDADRKFIYCLLYTSDAADE